MAKNIDVLITIPFNDSQQVVIKEAAPGLKIKMAAARKVDEISAELLEKAEVLYTDRILPSPNLAPKLKWVQFHFAGIDFAMENPLVKNPNIQITNLSGTASSQVAEYIVMMLLALGHRIPDLQRNQAASDWPRDRWERFSPVELRGSTVCLIGYGSIGRQVARLLQPFGVKSSGNQTECYAPDG